MARARNIKPGIFKNEVLGTHDPLLTLLFEGLWMLADREGRLEDRPLRIKAEVFPYRDGVDINAMLDWLADNGFIARYDVRGCKCIEVIEFLKHQKPHQNEPPSELPARPGTTKGRRTSTNGASPSTNGESTSENGARTRADLLIADCLLIDSLLIESPFLESLNTERFRSVWARWVEHRKQIRHPLTKTQAEGQLKKLAKEGEPAACDRVERSIVNGWRGLWFTDEGAKNGSPKTHRSDQAATVARQAEEAMRERKEASHG